jgi:hypothetical protein
LLHHSIYRWLANFNDVLTSVQFELTAYYSSQENTSTLDAIARLANLRIFIYQRHPETNILVLKTIRGNTAGTPTYLHHRAGGTDTHFELMSIVNLNPNINIHSSSSSASPSSTAFFTPLPSPSSNQGSHSSEKASIEDSVSLEL